MKPTVTSQTVDRALSLLGHFSATTPRHTLAELSSLAGLHRSIVYRLLCTMQQHGIVSYDRNRKSYSLGLRILELASVLHVDLDLKAVAGPFMRRVVAETGESVILTVLGDDDTAVCVEKVDTAHSVRVTSHLGSRMPLHAGSSQRILMAFLPEKRLERLLSQPLQRFTERTTVAPELLRRELAVIRERGWALSVGEVDQEVFALSVPVPGFSRDQVIASLAILGPETRLAEPPEEWVATLQRAAREIAAACHLSREPGGKGGGGAVGEPAAHRA